MVLIIDVLLVMLLLNVYGVLFAVYILFVVIIVNKDMKINVNNGKLQTFHIQQHVWLSRKTFKINIIIIVLWKWLGL